MLHAGLDPLRRRVGNGNDVQTLQLIQPFGEQLGNHGLVFNQDASQQDRWGPRGCQHRDRRLAPPE